MRGGSLAGVGDASLDRLISYDTALAPMVSSASEVSWHPALQCIFTRLSPENPDLPFCRSHSCAAPMLPRAVLPSSCARYASASRGAGCFVLVRQVHEAGADAPCVCINIASTINPPSTLSICAHLILCSWCCCDGFGGLIQVTYTRAVFCRTHHKIPLPPPSPPLACCLLGFFTLPNWNLPVSRKGCEGDRMSRPKRSAAPDFAAMAAKEELVDKAIARIARAPTAEELERKRLAQEAAEVRRAERRAAAEAAAAAAAAAAPAPEEEEEASESDGAEYKIERLLTCRAFSARAKFMLVKWIGFPHEGNTWEAKKHMHKDAIEDFERTAKLPFVLSELLELPPHASAALLEREHLLPVPPPREDDDEDDDDEDEDEEDEEVVEEGAGGGGVDGPAAAIKLEQGQAARTARSAAGTGAAATAVLEGATAVAAESDSEDERPIPVRTLNTAPDPASAAAAAPHAPDASVPPKPRRRRPALDRKLAEPPPPFTSAVRDGLLDALNTALRETTRASPALHTALVAESAAGSLQAAALALRAELNLPLYSILQACIATPALPAAGAVLSAVPAAASHSVFVGLGCGREDRRVRIVLPPLPRTDGTDGADGADGTDGGGAASSAGALVIELELPRKANIEYDSEEEEEETGGAARAAGNGGGVAKVEELPPAASTSTALPATSTTSAVSSAASSSAPPAISSLSSERNVMTHDMITSVREAMREAMREAVLAFDRSVTTRLRGCDLALGGGLSLPRLGGAARPPEFYVTAPKLGNSTAPAGAVMGAAGLGLAAAVKELVLLLLADRNMIVEPTNGFRMAMCLPHALSARPLWPRRWEATSAPAAGCGGSAAGGAAGGMARRARGAATSYAEVDEDAQDDAEAEGGEGSSFIPFGSVVAASGTSVRAIVGCASHGV